MDCAVLQHMASLTEHAEEDGEPERPQLHVTVPHNTPDSLGGRPHDRFSRFAQQSADGADAAVAAFAADAVAAAREGVAGDGLVWPAGISLLCPDGWDLQHSET
jgi:hypothetical protein